jgi:hypothetical protein
MIVCIALYVYEEEVTLARLAPGDKPLADLGGGLTMEVRAERENGEGREWKSTIIELERTY